MRTPNEVFKEMCPDHGETWTRVGDQWRCIRKDPQGNRYEDSSRTVPLPVIEMAMATGLTWIYFHSLTGEVEPLITKERKAQIIAARTQEQVDREDQRVLEMRAEQKREVESFVKHVFQRLGVAAEIAGIINQSKQPDKPTDKKEELN